MRRDEDGFALIAMVVAIFLVLLVLGVAAPRVAQQLRREREVEAVHRGNQYVRAVQLYYKKFGIYPASMEMLEKTNNVRYLRQKYIDPMTGKSDWRLIHVGEAKTTVKGFFGQPLAGLPSGLGSAAGMASPGGTGSPAGGASGGSNPASGSSSSFGSSSFGSSSFGSGSSGSSGPGSSSFGSSSFGSSSGSAFGNSSSGLGSNLGSSSSGSTPSGASGATGSTGGNGVSSQSATDFKGGGAPFLGVGSAAPGNSILVLNEQTTYGTWEFIYDPRIEQLKAKASLFGGGPASTSATGLGSAQGNVIPGLNGAVPPAGSAPSTNSPTGPSTPSTTPQ